MKAKGKSSRRGRKKTRKRKRPHAQPVTIRTHESLVCKGDAETPRPSPLKQGFGYQTTSYALSKPGRHC